MDILSLANKEKDLLIEMRRHLHENPELSNQEFQTLAYIKEKLTEFQIDFVEVENGGILAWVGDESRGEKKVLIRGDCDALPMQENEENLKGKKAVVSKNPGVCHACGHDAHTAMLIATAKVLKSIENELNGKVYLVFERGEEGTGNIKYLLRYFQEQNLNFDAVYGTHVLSTFETGKISVEPGGVMAGVQMYGFKIIGRGGHGSRPDLSVNPLDCFNAFYNGLHTLRMRFMDPFNSFTFSIGKVQAGNAFNVIPEELEFAGGSRFFDAKDGERFEKEMKALLEKTTEAYGCTYEMVMFDTPAIGLINNPQLSELAKEAIHEYVGPDFVKPCEPWMASESYSFYTALWPGVFAFLGMKNPEKGIGAEHHNERFDVDEDVLPLGVAAAAAYAVKFLQSDIKMDFTPFDGTPVELMQKYGKNFED